MDHISLPAYWLSQHFLLALKCALFLRFLLVGFGRLFLAFHSINCWNCLLVFCSSWLFYLFRAFWLIDSVVSLLRFLIDLLQLSLYFWLCRTHFVFIFVCIVIGFCVFDIVGSFCFFDDSWFDNLVNNIDHGRWIYTGEKALPWWLTNACICWQILSSFCKFCFCTKTGGWKL